MSVSSRVRKVAAAAGLALMSLAATFNSAAARPDELPAPAPITDTARPNLHSVPMTQAQKDTALAAALVALDTAIAQNERRNTLYDPARDPAIDTHITAITDAVKGGANPLFMPAGGVRISGVQNINALNAAVVLGTITERPALVQAFLDAGARPAARDASGMSAMDYIILLVRNSQLSDRSQTEASVKILQALTAAGGTLSDAQKLMRDNNLPAMTPDLLIMNLLGVDVLSKSGIIPPEDLRDVIPLTDAEAAALASMTDIDDAYLQSIGAKIVTANFASVLPGAPFNYTVVTGDNLWNIAERFRPSIGGADMTVTVRRLADRNGITIDSVTGDASRVLQVGESLTIPMQPHVKMGSMSVEPLDLVIGMARRLQPAMGVATLDEAFANFLAANNITTFASLNTLIAAGGPFKYTDTATGTVVEAPLAPTDVVEGFAFRRGLLQGPMTTPDEIKAVQDEYRAFMKHVADYNGLDLDALLTGASPMNVGTTYNILMRNDYYAHLKALVAPDSYDPAYSADLIVIEGGGGGDHAQRTYSAAVNSAFAVNPNADLSNIHAWEGMLINYPSGDDALRLMMNLKDSPLRDRVLFSFSMGVGMPFTQAERAVNTRQGDHVSFEMMKILLAEMEDNRPIIFASAGNEREDVQGMRPGSGRFVQAYLALHSPRAFIVGSIGDYPNLANEPTISPYSSQGGDVCAVLPKQFGNQQEGTSFSTPTLAAVARQMIEWYGNKLSFEEIMSVAMMVGARDVMDFDSFARIVGPGNTAVDATFTANGAGIPMHERCGSGILNADTIEQWNEALKVMVAQKATLDQVGEYTTSVIDIGDAVQVVTGARPADTRYIYNVVVPHDMTLDKLTFLLPQEAGAHSSVFVKTPSGFEIELSRSIFDIVSTRAFNYEDVKAGQVIQISAAQPLASGAAIYLRGHEDGNAIQLMRDHLRSQGVLHAPLERIVNGAPQTPAPAAPQTQPPVAPLPRPQ